MTTKIIGGVAIIHNDTMLIINGQSALDLIATVSHEHHVTKIAVSKNAISEDFFKLSTGLAGEIAQKFVNFRCQLAIIGDFSGYTSKPLRDYIIECNRGSHLFFVADEEEAVRKLGGDNADY